MSLVRPDPAALPAYDSPDSAVMVRQLSGTVHRIALADLALGVLLGLLPILVGLAGITSLGSHHGDEANFMQGAIDMLQTGNFLVPVYHGELVLDRAPLFYWLVAASFHSFGISLFAARLPTLLAAAVLTTLLYWFVVSMYGSRRSAFYAVIATLSSPVMWWILRLAVTDMVMTVGVFLGAAGYCYAVASPYRRLGLLTSSIGIGIAGMAKGHVGVVVAAVPLIALIAIVDRHAPYRLRTFDLVAPWTWLPAVVLCSWWYVYLVMSGAQVAEFASRTANPKQTLGAALITFLGSELIHQVQGGWMGLRMNLRMYSSGVFAWFVPWSLYVVGGLFLGHRVLRAEWREYPAQTRVLWTMIGSITVLFTFFVLELRSARYLLPITPAVAILAARCCVRREAFRGRHAWIPAPVAIGVIVLALSSAAFGFFLPTAIAPPLENLCATLNPRLTPSDAVVTLGLGNKWSTFATVLLGRPLQVLGDSSDAWDGAASSESMRSAASIYLLTTPKLAGQLQQRHPGEFEMVAQGQGGWIAEKNGLWEGAVTLRVTHQ